MPHFIRKDLVVFFLVEFLGRNQLFFQLWNLVLLLLFPLLICFNVVDFLTEPIPSQNVPFPILVSSSRSVSSSVILP